MVRLDFGRRAFACLLEERVAMMEELRSINLAPSNYGIGAGLIGLIGQTRRLQLAREVSLRGRAEFKLHRLCLSQFTSLSFKLGT